MELGKIIDNLANVALFQKQTSKTFDIFWMIFLLILESLFHIKGGVVKDVHGPPSHIVRK